MQSKWPFVPTCLSDILDRDTLAVIESGCCERLGRPLTILDYDEGKKSFIHRIESLKEKQRYEPFCRYFRDPAHVQGGDEACKAWDIEQGKVCLHEFQETKAPYRLFHCHMGLVDVTRVISIRDQPVALVFSGQFQPPEGTSNIQRNIQNLGSGTKKSLLASSEHKRSLLSLAKTITPLPSDVEYQLAQEANHIQKIAEVQFESSKRQHEQEFLDELRSLTNVTRDVSLDLFRKKMQLSLVKISEFCSTQYVVLFAAIREDDKILMPIAAAGVSEGLQYLPHFNWSKAKLPLSNFTISEWNAFKEIKFKGIRGNNREYFESVACMIPFASADRYRSVLAFGPFTGQVNLDLEHSFLVEIARIVGVYSSESLELLYLEQEKRRWKNTATLLNHEVKTALTPIATRVGRARISLQKRGNLSLEKTDKLLKEVEDLALLLGRVANGTLDGADLRVEHDDLEIESHSLSALVENCATGFLEAARNRGLELIIDPSIYTLPYAEMDVARLTIALSNLIENAIKYSFTDSKIYLRSQIDIAGSINKVVALIEVDNIGFEIREQEREQIFDLGNRGTSIAKIKKIPGSGYGLWESRSIIEAHGGEILVRFWPTLLHKQERRGTRVVFSMKIPLRQKNSGEEIR
jgi:signal transduction histidine kinase